MNTDRLNHALKYTKKLQRKRHAQPGGLPGFIYLIQCHQYVKVGYTDNVDLRLSSHQVGNPYQLTLLATFKTDNMVRDERRLHDLWQRYELRGEWFDVPAGELACVLSAETFDSIFTA